MGRGFLSKALSSGAQSASELIGLNIEESRKKRLARYETDLQKEIVGFTTDERVRGSVAEQEGLNALNEGRYTAVMDGDVQIGNKDTFTGQVVGDATLGSVRNVDKNIAATATAATIANERDIVKMWMADDLADENRDEIQDFQQAMQTQRLTSEGAYKRANMILSQIMQQRGFNQSDKEQFFNAKVEIGTAMIGATQETVEGLNKDMALFSKDPEKLAALEAQRKLAADNLSTIVEAIIDNDPKMEEVFKSLAVNPEALEEVDDTSPPELPIDTPSPETPVPSLTNRSGGGGLLEQAETRGFEKADLQAATSLRRRLTALKKRRNTVSSSQLRDVEQGIKDLEVELTSIYEKYGMTR